jgi:hypothetical protein
MSIDILHSELYDHNQYIRVRKTTCTDTSESSARGLADTAWLRDSVSEKK